MTYFYKTISYQGILYRFSKIIIIYSIKNRDIAKLLSTKLSKAIITI